MLASFRKYKLPIITVALMVLSTSVGFSIDMHYCQGNLKNISLIGDAQTCVDKAELMKSNHCEKKQKACHKEVQKSCGDEMNHEGCCSNNSVSIQLDEDFVPSNQVIIENFQAQFLLAFISSFLVLENRASTPIRYKNYKPPLLDKDIPILCQTFLC